MTDIERRLAWASAALVLIFGLLAVAAIMAGGIVH